MICRFMKSNYSKKCVLVCILTLDLNFSNLLVCKRPCLLTPGFKCNITWGTWDLNSFLDPILVFLWFVFCQWDFTLCTEESSFGAFPKYTIIETELKKIGREFLDHFFYYKVKYIKCEFDFFFLRPLSGKLKSSGGSKIRPYAQ